MRAFAIILAATVAVAPLSPATAAAATVQAAPASTADLAAGLDIPFETFTLDNGLTVVVHTDRKAPVVAVHAWYNVGAKDEPEGQTGFAHLFEHIGLFNPTENVQGGLMEPLRAMGATDWNGTTNFDRTNFFQTVPTAALEQALYMESDRMGHLLGALTQERLDNQRGVVQNEKRQGDNQPFGLTFYATLEALFPPGHPYRHSTIGSMADLDAASLQDLRDWHHEKYGPNNAVLVLVGDIDTATARTLVQKYFGHIPRGPQNVPADADVPTLAERTELALQDRVAFTRLYRTWVTPGLLDVDDAANLEIAASIIGGLGSSRLDNALVRGDQSAISVGGFSFPFHRVGLTQFNVDVKPGQDADAVGRRFDALIADLIANGPSEDEVRRAVTSRMAGEFQNLESVGGFSGKAVILAESALYSGDAGFYRRQFEALARVTPASVQAAAAKWLGRPVLAMRVDPGEREPYQEAAANRPPPAPIQTLEVTPRDPMPGVGQVGELAFPATERARLSNGVRVIYARSETVPITRVAVDFDAGVGADPLDAQGTQSLMLNLLDEGAGALDSVGIAEVKERLGATITTGATMDRTQVTLSTLSANLAPSLDLLADIVRRPTFAPAELERLRAQQLATVASERTQPNAIGLRVLPALLYGADHPYGRSPNGLGDEAALRVLGRDELVAFHQTWLRPDTATVFVTSDRPLAEITPLLEARFGDWTAPDRPRGVKAFDRAIPAPQPRIVLIDRPQSPQSVIMGGQVLPLRGADDPLVFNAANESVGSGFLARINQDIRETRGWSYGLGGSAAVREHQMAYIINAPVQADRTGESIQVLMQQYEAFLGERGVTPAERQRIVQGNSRQLAGAFETSAAVLGALRTNNVYNRPDDYWRQAPARYNALTVEAMDAAARAALKPDAFTWVVVGDAAVVRPQLEALGLPVEVRSASGQ